MRIEIGDDVEYDGIVRMQLKTVNNGIAMFRDQYGYFVSWNLKHVDALMENGRVKVIEGTRGVL